MKIPDVALEYWGWTHPPTGVAYMLSIGLYGMDDRRAECHDRLCEYYGIDKETSKQVTDHLDKFEHVGFMHNALEKLQK